MTDDFRSHTVLGRTGLRVSRLGMASGYGVPATAVERAHGEYGINYFYWGSRRGAGMAEALRRMVVADREKLVIALQSYDHLGWFMGGGVEKGLRRLGIEYADVLILGWFNRHPGRRILDAAGKLKDRGLVRYLAMSGHNRRLFGEMAGRKESPIDIFMVRYNAAHRGAEEEIFPFLPEAGAPGVTTYTATRWGKLLDPRKMPPGEGPLTAADCYRFVLSHPRVDLCMTGPRSYGEFEEGMAALGGGPITDEERERICRIGDHVRGKR
jgi:aryl-alcohol dehydrogenase-like predicted oxidoreductase